MKKYIVVAAIIIAAAFIFAASSRLQVFFENTTTAVDNYSGEKLIIGLGAFIIFSAVSAVLSPFSSIPAVPFISSALGEGVAFTLLLLGWFIGSLISYALGKYAFFELFKNLIPFQKIEDYRKEISERSEFLLVVLFRLALPTEITGIVLGSLRYDFIKYLLATIITEIPFAFIAVNAGEAFVAENPWEVTLWIFLGGIVVATALLMIRKKLN